MKKIMLMIGFVFGACLYASPGDNDTTFNSPNGYVTLANTTFYSILEDSSGDLYAVGTQNSEAVIAKYDSNGNLDTSFNSPNGYIVLSNHIDGPVYGVMDSSDRIFIVGLEHGSGVTLRVLKVLADGTGLDTAFHSPNGYYSINLSTFGVQISELNGAVMDPTDRIYIYGSGNDLAKDAPLLVCGKTDGSGLDTSFGNGGVIYETGVTDSNSFNASWKGLAIDTAVGNRIVLTGWAEGQGASDATHMIIARYTLTGDVIDFDGDVESVVSPGSGIKGIWVHSMSSSTSQDSYGQAVFVDGNSDWYVVGQAQNGLSQNYAFIAKFDTDTGFLIPGFAASGQLQLSLTSDAVEFTTLKADSQGDLFALGSHFNTIPMPTGEIIYKINPTGSLDASFGTNGLEDNFTDGGIIGTIMPYDMILQDGVTPVYAGVTTLGSGVMGRLRIFDQGDLDQTFGSSGELTLNGVASMTTGDLRALHVLPDGSMFVVNDAGSDTQVVKLTSAHIADTGFGGDGERTLSGMDNPVHVITTVNGDVLACGGNGASGSDAAWLHKFNSTGIEHPSLEHSVTDRIDQAFKVVEQSTGRWILAGSEDGVATLIAYNPVDGAVDTSFGGAGTGRYTIAGVSNPIVDVTVIDGTDEILIAYVDGSNQAQVKKLTPNGRSEVSEFTFGTVIGSVAGATQVRMRRMADGKIVVVARDGSNNFVARRYTAAGADDAGATTVNVTNLNDLSDLLALSDGKVVILGKDSSNNLILVRLASSLGTDFAFDDDGKAVINTATMTKFAAVDVQSDNSLLVAGS